MRLPTFTQQGIAHSLPVLMLGAIALGVFITVNQVKDVSNTQDTRSHAAMATTYQGLRVQGNQIVNSNGETVKLRAVNYSGMEFACVGTNGTDGYDIFDGPSPVNMNFVNGLKSWKINAVRINLNEQCWLGVNGVKPAYSGANYQNALKPFVDLLTQNNIIVLLDLHWSAGGTNKALDLYAMPGNHAPEFWRQVANVYKGNSMVMFDLFNEPHPNGGLFSTQSWTCWRDGGNCGGQNWTAVGMQELVNAVRSTGSTNILSLSGPAWGADIKRWVEFKPNDPHNNLVASVHVYAFSGEIDTQAEWEDIISPTLAKYPVIAGEFGDYDDHHNKVCNGTFPINFAKWMDAKNATGYFGWVWQTWDGKYNGRYCMNLIANFDGTPNGAYGTAFKNYYLSAAPSPAPTTAATPTATPSTTATPVPTGTPVITPTATPRPTNTATPNPTPTATPTSGAGYRSTVPNDGPIAYWRLGEKTGTQAVNEKGTNHGEYRNSPTLGLPGALVNDTNTTVAFNGRNSFMRVPYRQILNPAVFTIETWVYPTGGNGYQAFAASRDYPRGWVLYKTEDNRWSFWINRGSTMVEINGPTVTNNVWTHVVGTYDGSMARLYINGVEAASAAVSNYNPNRAKVLTVGQGTPGDGFFFLGAVDDVSLYNKALNALQVRVHYNAGKGI